MGGARAPFADYTPTATLTDVAVSLLLPILLGSYGNYLPRGLAWRSKKRMSPPPEGESCQPPTLRPTNSAQHPPPSLLPNNPVPSSRPSPAPRGGGGDVTKPPCARLHRNDPEDLESRPVAALSPS